MGYVCQRKKLRDGHGNRQQVSVCIVRCTNILRQPGLSRGFVDFFCNLLLPASGY